MIMQIRIKRDDLSRYRVDLIVILIPALAVKFYFINGTPVVIIPLDPKALSLILRKARVVQRDLLCLLLSDHAGVRGVLSRRGCLGCFGSLCRAGGLHRAGSRIPCRVPAGRGANGFCPIICGCAGGFRLAGRGASGFCPIICRHAVLFDHDSGYRVDGIVILHSFRLKIYLVEKGAVPAVQARRRKIRLILRKARRF